VKVLLDTHIVLWWQADTGRLSGTAERAIQGAETLMVSPLSCWEIATLARQGRVALDREPAAWIGRLLHEPRVALAPLTAEAAVWAGLLDHEAFPGDPIDRMIYASAHDLRIPLVTKDEKLRAYATEAGEIDVIW
jgi:PIN domain nuclease of toxin-antitoxin system